jgi:uroporphyrinogen-III synthase
VKTSTTKGHARTEALVRPCVRISHEGPLTGVRVLVGRARHQAGKLSSGLRKLGAEVIEIPFIEIRPPRSYRALDESLRNLHNYDWLILTSVNGVEAFWQQLKRQHLSKRYLQHLKIAAIGPATKKAIEKRGVVVSVVPKEYVAESVIASLRTLVAGKRVLLARAKVARDVIPTELRNLGATVDVVEAYETVIPRSSGRRLRAVLKDQERRPDVITFTSSSTVRNFIALLKSGSRRGQGAGAYIGEIKLASIGPVTSSALRELGLRVDLEAKEFSIPGLIDTMIANLNQPPQSNQ